VAIGVEFATTPSKSAQMDDAPLHRLVCRSGIDAWGATAMRRATPRLKKTSWGAALRAFGSDEDFRGGVDDPAAAASQSVSDAYIGRICGDLNRDAI
jgi:hypothetical protein